LHEIFTALELNELLMPTRVLTGYIPNGEVLRAVGNIVAKLKETKPGIIYLLDRMSSLSFQCYPKFIDLIFQAVMGDSGKLYVSPDVVPVYRELLPLATIITPNWFEVE
jgi:pyridoxine kinase